MSRSKYFKRQKCVSGSSGTDVLQPSGTTDSTCDASERELGVALLQDGQAIYFASRTLTATEVCYAQIEKAMLAIVLSLYKFHQYTFGRHVHCCSHWPQIAAGFHKNSGGPSSKEIRRNDLAGSALLYRHTVPSRKRTSVG